MPTHSITLFGHTPCGQRAAIHFPAANHQVLRERLSAALATLQFTTAEAAHFRVIGGGHVIAIADTQARRVILLKRPAAHSLLASLSAKFPFSLN
jgi:hypothetical protein